MAAWGFHYYLTQYCHCHISWDFDQLHLPFELPNLSIRISSNDQFVQILLPNQDQYFDWSIVLPLFNTDFDTIRMFALLAIVQLGGSGPDGREKLTGWLWTESTYLWLLWDKKSFGKEFICLLALTSKILTNILRGRHFLHGEFQDHFIMNPLLYYHWFHL